VALYLEMGPERRNVRDADTTAALGSLPAEIAAFVDRHVGALSDVRFCSWDHGVSDVWDCRTTDGRHVFVKSCRDKYDQEVHAYRTWAPQLGDRCPRLLAADDQLGVLVLTAVKGTLAERVELDADVFVQAGRWLSGLHSLALDVGEPTAPDDLVERAERWDRRAESVVDHEDRRWMMARVHEVVALLPNVRRVPCHRDYTPRNWVVDDSRTLRVIDFGHTRADYWILDVDKLWSEHWVARPDVEEAFWDGYGTRPTIDELAVLEAASALGAVSTIAWSREHGDREYEAHGRAHLARLRRRHREQISGAGPDRR
jgi:Ser/Thr protein kinase RdoA (MazF antagonist)